MWSLCFLDDLLCLVAVAAAVSFGCRLWGRFQFETTLFVSFPFLFWDLLPLFLMAMASCR